MNSIKGGLLCNRPTVQGPRAGGYCARSISMKRVRPPTRSPEPSAARLALRALSTGVVDSLGEGFENSKTLKVNGSLIRQ
jgi:hypothetical protein